MRVLLFQDRFAGKVRDGSKRQTIRKTARCKPGDALSLRRWKGKPYRSKQEVLRTTTCKSVESVAVFDFDVHVCCKPFPAQHLAVMDGFRDWPEMRDWFARVHGLPLSGWLIKW